MLKIMMELTQELHNGIIGCSVAAAAAAAAAAANRKLI